MAHLNGTKTDGRPAWEFYIQNNPKWRNLDLVIENKLRDVPVYKSKAQFKVVKTMNQGARLKLTSSKYEIINGDKYAKTTQGLIAIKHIRKPSGVNTLKDEEVAINNLQKLLSDIGYPITIWVLDDDKKKIPEKYENIVKVGDVRGTPKADFSLDSDSGKPLIFISHKKAGGAAAFQQYSGVSKQAGAAISQHREVLNFLRDLIPLMDPARGLSQAAYRYIKDDKLINLSIFGPDYGKKFGTEHCQVIGQGNPILKPVARKDGEEYILAWSDHSAIAGNLKTFKTGDYKPVIGATYRAGRKFMVDGRTYTGARVGIYPYGLFKTRKAIEL